MAPLAIGMLCARLRQTPAADGLEEISMHEQMVSAPCERTFAVVFDVGDEVISGLCDVARRNGLADSHFTAIGGFCSAVLGYFDWQTKQFKRIPVDEQVEVLVLAGDITCENSGPQVHTHVVLGKADGTAVGGHLLEARVRPTLEVMLVESPVQLHRKHDAATGLALIDLSASKQHAAASGQQQQRR